MKFVLQPAQGIVQRLRLRLAQQKVYLFGHEDVTEEEKLVAPADDFEDVKEDLSRVVMVEMGQAALTAEGEEVVIAVILVPFQSAGHGSIVMPKSVNPHSCAKDAHEWGTRTRFVTVWRGSAP